MESMMEIMNENAILSTFDARRKYKFDGGKCEKFLRDIFQCQNEGRNAFCGSVTLKKSDDSDGCSKYIVVDGLKRIVTLQIAIIALCNLCSDDERATDLRDKFLFVKTSTGHCVPKIQLNGTDEIIFNTILENVTLLTEDQKASCLYRNYLLTENFMRKSLEENGFDGTVALFFSTDAFRNILNANIDELSAYISVNDTHTSLAADDYIKGNIFTMIPETIQSKFNEVYWNNITACVPEEEIDSFLIGFFMLENNGDRIVKGKDCVIITKSTLKKCFDMTFSQKNKKNIQRYTADFLTRVVKRARYYAKCKMDIGEDRMRLPETRRLVSDLVNVWGTPATIILLMWLFEKQEELNLSEPIMISSLCNLVSFAVRGWVCKGSGLSKQYISIILPKLSACTSRDSFIVDFTRIITGESKQFAYASDAEFRRHLIEKDLCCESSIKKVHALLYDIERLGMRSKELPIYTTLTVEHILPQNPSSKEREQLTKYFPDFEKYTNNLGNLTLTGYNGELSNNPYEDKKTLYAKSNFLITREICDYEKWDKESILDRANRLADSAVLIWRLHEFYKEDFIKKNYAEKIVAMYGIMELSKSDLTNSKCDGAILNDKKYGQMPWQELFFLIVFKIDEMFPDIWEKITLDERMFSKKKPRDAGRLSRTRRLKNGIYVTPTKSGPTRLFPTICKILTQLSSEANSETANNFISSMKIYVAEPDAKNTGIQFGD